MSTVVKRSIRSTPFRDGGSTWGEIVELLSARSSETVKAELLSISGIAGSLIGDKDPEDAAIVVTCDGPRTRIYCLYDDAAVDGSDSNEDVLGFDPLEGDWKISLPCNIDDLEWVQSGLAEKSVKITARDKSQTIQLANKQINNEANSLEINLEEFLK